MNKCPDKSFKEPGSKATKAQLRDYIEDLKNGVNEAVKAKHEAQERARKFETEYNAIAKRLSVAKDRITKKHSALQAAKVAILAYGAAFTPDHWPGSSSGTTYDAMGNQQIVKRPLKARVLRHLYTIIEKGLS